MTRPNFLETPNGVDEHVARLLDAADSIAFVTLWETPDVLLARLRRRVRAHLKGRGLLRVPTHLRRYRTRHSILTNTSELWQLYKKWFLYCERFGDCPHWIIRSRAPDLTCLSAWLRETPFWESRTVPDTRLLVSGT